MMQAQAVSVQIGAKTILDAVDLELHAGEIVALLGPNGAGKSTLLRTIAGLVKPNAGQLECASRVALAMQSADLAARTVQANVELALQWWGVPRKQRAARAEAALSEAGAEHLRQRQASALSGGERRRVHLARALAMQAEVLLLDEPFAGVDVLTRGALLDDAADALRSPAGATLVVVHDRAEAWALADRLVILIDGRVVASGLPQELIERPPTSAIARFLGYDGELRQNAELLLTRPVHVRIEQDGPLAAQVLRAIPQEDSVRLELELAHGRLFAAVPHPAPRVGESVGVRLCGGVRFGGEEALDDSGPPADGGPAAT